MSAPAVYRVRNRLCPLAFRSRQGAFSGGVAPGYFVNPLRGSEIDAAFQFFRKPFGPPCAAVKAGATFESGPNEVFDNCEYSFPASATFGGSVSLIANSKRREYSMRNSNRRLFLQQAVGAMAGGTMMGSTAQSYSRILGSNDRISLGHVGTGNRGRSLEFILSKLKDKMNVEVTALCDLWKVNRERMASMSEKRYGRAPPDLHRTLRICWRSKILMP